MDVNELLFEFRQLGATVGDHDDQPGSFIQDGLGLVLRVNSKMLSLTEAHEYLHQLREESGKSQTCPLPKDSTN